MSRELNSPKKVYGKVASTMRMENHILKKSDAARIMKCVSGEKTFDSARNELVRKHIKPVLDE